VADSGPLHYGERVAQRGRPKGGDSAETRLRIIDAARTEFARCGFEGASVAMIAAHAELAPSAVYHYFGGKVALYEDVYAATADAIWSEFDSAALDRASLLDAVVSIMRFAASMDSDRRIYNDFLALVPMEATLHPEFRHMLDWRTKRQDATFGALAELGIRCGELNGFTLDEATEVLRSLMMGWFLEAYFRPSSLEPGGQAVVNVIRVLGQR